MSYLLTPRIRWVPVRELRTPSKNFWHDRLYIRTEVVEYDTLKFVHELERQEISIQFTFVILNG